MDLAFVVLESVDESVGRLSAVFVVEADETMFVVELDDDGGGFTSTSTCLCETGSTMANGVFRRFSAGTKGADCGITVACGGGTCDGSILRETVILGRTRDARLPVHVEQAVQCELSVVGLCSVVWNRVAFVLVVLG